MLFSSVFLACDNFFGFIFIKTNNFEKIKPFFTLKDFLTAKKILRASKKQSLFTGIAF